MILFFGLREKRNLDFAFFNICWVIKIFLFFHWKIVIPVEVLMWNRYQAVANFFHLAITAYCWGSVDTFPDWEEIESFSHLSLLGFFSFKNRSREVCCVFFKVDFPLLCIFKCFLRLSALADLKLHCRICEIFHPC